jgi:PrgI family protein
MRFEVPQFIEIEDKIIGPLTWKQFVYLAGGVGILLILFFAIDTFAIFVALGLPLGALSVSLAFQRVNNRPFSIFLESSINYFTKSKLYLWKKEAQQAVIQKTEAFALDEEPTILEFGRKRSINALSRKLELRLPE